MQDIESTREALMTAVLRLSLIHSHDPAIEATLRRWQEEQRSILDQFNAVMT